MLVNNKVPSIDLLLIVVLVVASIITIVCNVFTHVVIFSGVRRM